MTACGWMRTVKTRTEWKINRLGHGLGSSPL